MDFTTTKIQSRFAAIRDKIEAVRCTIVFGAYTFYAFKTPLTTEEVAGMGGLIDELDISIRVDLSDSGVSTIKTNDSLTVDGDTYRVASVQTGSTLATNRLFLKQSQGRYQ